VQFTDQDNGVIAGEFGTLLTTSNGGETWQKVAGLPTEFYPYAMLFVDRNRGWVSGIGGSMLETLDAGRSWASQRNLSGTSMYSLLAVGSQILAVGGSGQIVQLIDQSWRPIVNASDYSLADLSGAASLGPRRLLVAGAAGVLRVIGVGENNPLEAHTPHDRRR
jgi:photosystem II stability/assembly factor-like uncharacterized protein